MTTKQAVILASGLGSRLAKDGNSHPKSLMPVAGMPLISRVIALLEQAKITKIVVVVGYKKEEVISFLEKHHPQVLVAENDEFRKSNGLSLLAAKSMLDHQKPFVLTMVDHIFEDGWVVEFLAGAEKRIKGNGAVLAADGAVDDVFDIDDATKVFVEDDKIIKIGKQLQAYNRIDTGMFLCKWSLFSALESVKKERGDASISDGMTALIETNSFSFVDMTGHLWQDVDTPGMKKEAENRLLEQLVDPPENFFALPFHSFAKIVVSNLFRFDSITADSIIRYYLFFLALFIPFATLARISSLAVVSFLVTVFMKQVMDIMLSLIPDSTTRKQRLKRYYPAALTLSMLPIAAASAPLIGGISATVAVTYALLVILHGTLPVIRQFTNAIKPFLSVFSWELFWFVMIVYLFLPLPLWPLFVLFVLFLPLVEE